MDFGQKQTLKGAPAIVGSQPNGNIVHQVLVDNGVTGLLPGHVVVIADGSVSGRWSGDNFIHGALDGDGNLLYSQLGVGIVTAQQFEGDNSVSVLRAGTYIRDRILLSDDSGLTTSAEFKLSLCQLFAEGAWV